MGRLPRRHRREAARPGRRRLPGADRVRDHRRRGQGRPGRAARHRAEHPRLGQRAARPHPLKYLLVEGSYDGDRDARWVFTGSHNYNETSLRRNDETLLRLNDKNVYRQYVANFERMRAAATQG
ncbi:phospholipase D-like domain-containing protein [Nonomuraea thailandensis]